MSPRWLTILCLLIAPAFARAAEQNSVEAHLTGGSKLNGFLKEPSIAFRFEGGSAQFDVARVEHLNLVHTVPAADSIRVHGFSEPISGICENPTFTITTDNAVRVLQRSEITSIRSVRPTPAGIFSRIVLPLITLTAMEIVLGIDNIIFLALVAGRLPPQQQPRARRLGLLAALGTRLLLLATLSFILSLTTPVFTLPNMPLFHELEARQISWRDIILLVGGVFLIGKSTFEIHDRLERPSQDEHAQRKKGTARFGWVLIEIAVIDIIFSLDSVVTAVGMVESLGVMIAAMIMAVGVMMLFAEAVARFVTRHPTLKILALAFMILIGVLLVAEGCGQHIDKGYVYFAMAFSVLVEIINLRVRKKTEPLHLHDPGLPAGMS
ncbi:MAG: TerC family protein [Gemmataceae bacterium]